MKVFKDLYKETISTENLFRAWKVFHRGKARKKDVMEFEPHPFLQTTILSTITQVTITICQRKDIELPKKFPREKEEIIRTIFSELYISEKTLEYKLQTGFDCFENRFQAICDPTAWLSELVSQRDYIKSSIISLEELMVK